MTSWHRRHPAGFVFLVVLVSLLTLALTAVIVCAVGLGLLIGFAHMMSDPVPKDARDAATVRHRVQMYGEDLDAGRNVDGSTCASLRAGSSRAARWFPPGPRTAGVVAIDGDDATVVVGYPATTVGATRTTLKFRYEVDH